MEESSFACARHGKEFISVCLFADCSNNHKLLCDLCEDDHEDHDTKLAEIRMMLKKCNRMIESTSNTTPTSSKIISEELLGDLESKGAQVKKIKDFCASIST